ncbi:NUDIX domain-containing protein [Streptomyces antimicrobicus]|uniref:NUDIX hydrolase n=1 Tax=Streptomyces antimicrobicus TaxID=2883108 RepID=A0ABS8B3L7_9ACTN|nr:NUDIX hydrolase [Streptomyces antimicrobicus]MCB5179218.1 NUDIX hydrolase [Streptomyces antimicrobicus]
MTKEWLPPEEFAATLPKAAVFGAVFFTDDEDRPVQLRATYSSIHPWQWPGGVAEPGERPWETAVRECREETGLLVPGPPRLLAAVFGLPGADWPLNTVGFVFDGGRLDAARLAGVRLDPDEHDDVRALSVPDWRDLMPARDHARLEAVMEARRTGVPAYFDTWDWES